MKVKVIGAGLAGCEAAWQLANRGVEVTLYEMKPEKRSDAHHYDHFAELVCSNSLRSNQLANAVGLLKEEMRRLDSVIMQCADATAVPAGGALAVDRIGFGEMVTKCIREHKNITVEHGEVTALDVDVPTIVASGPLTSDALSEEIQRITDKEYLHFFDAAAPMVTKESLDMDKAFFAARYDRGTADYINCPMNKEEYEAFYDALVHAETVQLKSFENLKVFEGCMPVEVMASRGHDTLLFGPLKPVGITNPKTGKDDFYAVIQLRQDNAAASLYNIVGFQTHLTFGEQKRVFSMIPGLENAEFVRYGVMHRNTFLNSPKLLNNAYQLREHKNIFFAGQITGVEGYVESAASGLTAGINMARYLKNEAFVDFTRYTAIGALANYISDASVEKFQPMTVNFGIIENLGERIKNKRERYERISARALEKLDTIDAK
ncbi:MAG: methylenetetrahydrofolate--tRNA-(uracil(54)-C(5))-methyltransferase (FADH(2)-oxidizing) TrmFO [Clostridia bacterium]|nr:methylenetetrahydrofolate--tRNA-(uracil(54)-C(5))-methyltransferase (FADH(2)-oxidizing) TrmFO [Clostridia bacterium]